MIRRFADFFREGLRNLLRHKLRRTVHLPTHDGRHPLHHVSGLS